MVKVSVIVPVFNAENFIDRCLNSIVSQTYSNLEIILINDGSEDNSLICCKKYAQRDERIIVLNRENNGVAKTRDIGLEHATGEFILFVDSDDWIDSRMVETMLQAVNESNGCADIVVCSSDHAAASDETVSLKHTTKEIWNPEKQKKEFLIHQKLQGMLWNKLIRTSLFDDVRFDYSVGYAEDAQVVWKLLQKNCNMIILGDVLYHHVIESGSISNQRFSPVKYSVIKVWKEIEKSTKTLCPHMTVLATERLTFYAVFTIFEMMCAAYDDKTAEKEFTQILRNNKILFMKSKNISVKTKVFASALLVSRSLAKKLCALLR